MSYERRHLEVWPDFARKQKKVGIHVPVKIRKGKTMLIEMIMDGLKISLPDTRVIRTEAEQIVAVDDWYGKSLCVDGLARAVKPELYNQVEISASESPELPDIFIGVLTQKQWDSLQLAGFLTVQDFINADAKALKGVDGVGMGTVKQVKDALSEVVVPNERTHASDTDTDDDDEVIVEDLEELTP